MRPTKIFIDKNKKNMNSIMFMPSIMPHCGGGGDFTELLVMLLTFIIAGVVLIIFGIFANILHIKFSQGFDSQICWADIKPNFDNSFLGCLCGTLGVIYICASLIVGLIACVYWFIITL
jgi:hypothetical protein